MTEIAINEIKFRFVFKKNDRLFFIYYTLDQLIQGEHLHEEEPIAHGCELISKDQYSGFKDKNGKELYCNDICVTRYLSHIKVSIITIALWIIDEDKMNHPMNYVIFIGTTYENQSPKEL